MTNDRDNIDSIFCKAVEIEAADKRYAYVESACSGNPELRERVERLLDAHSHAGSFLSRPAPELDVTTDVEFGIQRPGQTIGRYKLREQLGAGGFGVVWAAEQTEPVHRKVALKIVKPGMDTRDVIARFEAERQALAMMDHQNIARVLDAGTTEQGRPYFVMELIRGVPITEYCDENKLSVHERLELFVQTCRAVQHAHQKGIIHRDIKPSNVLVTLHDGVPVPKVIDFGIAKALSQRLTEKTVYTRVHQAIGTLAYMSPEAAELSGLDMDTRADVYGLGVLLYELLTGATPFDKKRLEEAALHEACRIIREEDPPKASTRLSTLGETATVVSAQRKTQPRDLTQLVRGDLDWILIKALEKDRTRRYESASAFAADIQRCLNNEPIEARPPSTAYRLRKLASRHRAVLATTLLVMFALISGIVTSTWMAIQADRANRKLQATLVELQDALLERGFNLAFSGDLVAAQRVIEHAERAGLGEEWQSTLEGAAHLFRGDVKNAMDVLHEAAADESNVSAVALLGAAYIQALEYSKFEQLYPTLQRIRPRAAYRDYDELLLAYAAGTRDLTDTVDRMESVLQRRPSWILPRALIGDCRMVAGQSSGERHQLELAHQVFEGLQAIYPDNLFVTRYRFGALMGALEFGRRHELPSFPDVEAKALLAAETLVDYKLADRLRPHFYDFVGKEEKARVAWLVASKQGSALKALDAIGFLYRTGNDADAWTVVEQRRETPPEVMLAKSYMLVDVPERREEAKQLCIAAVDECPTWWMRQMASKVFLLLGEIERAKEVCAEWTQSETESESRCQWIWLDKQSIDFLAGTTGQDQYRQADETLGGKFYYDYTMGCLAIGEGEWENARMHLQSCVANSSFIWPESNWAKAFLERLETDSGWPRAHRLRLQRP